MSSNNDNVPSADDLAQPASINSSNHNSTTFANVVVAAATTAKIKSDSDQDSLVSSANLHHFDNFSLKRNHNVSGKQTDFCHSFKT